jgi:hypothetical protein
MTEQAHELEKLAHFHWVFTGSGGKRLHAVRHAVWNTEDWLLEQVEFACGKRAQLAWIPGFVVRLEMLRCKACCRRMGFPEGTGAPKLDKHCRKVMGWTDDD